jgi:hypothetical protein
MRIPRWTWFLLAVVVVIGLVNWNVGAIGGCPGSQVYCAGVGCVSGPDKCTPGAKGGPSAVFSKEGFDVKAPKPWSPTWAEWLPPSFRSWPGSGAASVPPSSGDVKENFVSKNCKGGYRSDGPCLMDFPDM